jgi:pimeloyl-ACP methyl ester carboxylesterase
MATATPVVPPHSTRCILLCAATLLSAACSDLPTANDSSSTAPEAQLLTINPTTQCPTGTTGTEGTLDDGSLYEFCPPSPPAIPLGLVLFAHGYSQPGTPLTIVDNEIPVGDGTTHHVSEVVTSLGLGFGTTSYPHVGLNGPEGVASLHALRQAFTTNYPQAAALPTYLVGVSEGGFIAALAAEQVTNDFKGVLAACGPVGDFRRQIDYFGDFRVLFDYFFPGVLGPAWTDDADYGAAARAQVAANWDFYQGQIIAALRARPLAAAQLISVSRAPINPLDLNSIGETAIAVLWYNIFSTDDAVQRLGRRPFDNHSRFYTGSFSDFLLNARVKRFTAQATALATMQSEFTTTARSGCRS